MDSVAYGLLFGLIQSICNNSEFPCHVKRTIVVLVQFKETGKYQIQWTLMTSMSRAMTAVYCVTFKPGMYGVASSVQWLPSDF
jgi:hypothetical protein